MNCTGSCSVIEQRHTQRQTLESFGALHPLTNQAKVLTAVQYTAKASDNDKKRKEKMKRYADNKCHAKTFEIKLGDTVLVKQPKKNKFTTTFDPNPLTVVPVKGSMISAQGARTRITRNVSHFKKFEGERTCKESVSAEKSDDEPNDYDVPRQVVPAEPPAEAPRRYPVRQLRTVPDILMRKPIKVLHV